MCVAAVAWNAHPHWRLVAAGNRDELHARPAAALGRWEGHADVLAGRDLKSGGTWFGLSQTGRMAIVTNLRGYGPPADDRPSRGLLLADLLTGEGDWAEPSDAHLAHFNPFNLIRFGQDGLQFWTNRPAVERRRLEASVYALSNGPLDAPWPKTLRLRAILDDWLGESSPDPRSLLPGLAEDRLPPAAQTAIGASDAPQEPPVTPIFVRDPVWGTRCSTVAAVHRHGHGIMVERRFSPAGQPVGDTVLAFAWPQGD